MVRHPSLAPVRGLVLGALVACLGPAAETGATVANDLCAAAADPCVWSGTLTVTPASILDFGPRGFVIGPSGILNVVEGDVLTVRAQTVTLQPGARIRSASAGGFGPDVKIEVIGDIDVEATETSAASIDVSGGGQGGVITLLAGGDIQVGGNLRAMGTLANADGGIIEAIAQGDMKLGGQIRLSGSTDARGGSLAIQARSVTVGGSGIDASGDLDGGEVALGGRAISVTSTLLAHARHVAGGFGGTVDLAAAVAGEVGPMDVSGTINVNGTARGGTIELQGCDVTVAGSLLAKGPTGGANGIRASGQLTVDGVVDALPGGLNDFQYRQAALPPLLEAGSITPAPSVLLAPALLPCLGPTTTTTTSSTSTTTSSQVPTTVVTTTTSTTSTTSTSSTTTSTTSPTSSTTRPDATTTTTSSTTSTTAPRCGNGVLDAGEVCDDGNQLNNDCCISACEVVLRRGTPCGEAALGECDNGDVCDSEGRCTANPKPAETPCSDDGETCTVDVCDGTGECIHRPGNADALCREATSVCETEARCDGTSPECPPSAACEGEVTPEPGGNRIDVECQAPDTVVGGRSDCEAVGFEAGGASPAAGGAIFEPQASRIAREPGDGRQVTTRARKKLGGPNAFGLRKVTLPLKLNRLGKRLLKKQSVLRVNVYVVVRHGTQIQKTKRLLEILRAR